MAPQIQKEHAVETYKSLVQIGVEGLKIIGLLNGGAAVALLAYLGNVTGKGLIPDMRLPMGAYLCGLVLCGLAFIVSYVTQLTLYNESMGFTKDEGLASHRTWLRFAMFLALASVFCFAAGSYVAVSRFTGDCPIVL